MTQVELPSHLNKEEVFRSQRRLETRMKNLWKAYPSLLEKYPDQWILWDGENVVHATETGKDMLRYIDDNDIDISCLEIEHLETNPRKMIL